MARACCASSSTTSSSRSCPEAASSARISAGQCISSSQLSALSFQLFESGDAGERLEEVFPDASLAAKGPAAGDRDAVIAPAPLAGLLDPASFEQPFLFHSIQRRVGGGDGEADRAARPLIDPAREVVSVPLAFGQQRQDQQLGAAPLQLARKRIDAH